MKRVLSLCSLPMIYALSRLIATSLPSRGVMSKTTRWSFSNFDIPAGRTAPANESASGREYQDVKERGAPEACTASLCTKISLVCEGPFAGLLAAPTPGSASGLIKPYPLLGSYHSIEPVDFLAFCFVAAFFLPFRVDIASSVQPSPSSSPPATGVSVTTVVAAFFCAVADCDRCCFGF